MMEQDNGRFGDADRAVVNGASDAVSAVPASIPSADPIVNDCPFCGCAAEIIYHGWDCGAHIECEECESRTRHIEDEMTSIENAHVAARLWNTPTDGLARLAQAMETRSAETQAQPEG